MLQPFSICQGLDTWANTTRQMSVRRIGSCVQGAQLSQHWWPTRQPDTTTRQRHLSAVSVGSREHTNQHAGPTFLSCWLATIFSRQRDSRMKEGILLIYCYFICWSTSAVVSLCQMSAVQNDGRRVPTLTTVDKCWVVCLGLNSRRESSEPTWYDRPSTAV